MNKDTVTEMTENFKNMIVVIAKYSTTPDGAGIISSAINKVLEEQQSLHPSPSQGQSHGLNGSVWDKGKMKFIPEDVYKLINRTGDGAFGVMTKDWEDYKEGEYFYDNAQQLFGEISGNGGEGELNKWEKALLSLTPGGSEFVDDPDYCVKVIKDYQASQHKYLCELKIENKKLQASASYFRQRHCHKP